MKPEDAKRVRPIAVSMTQIINDNKAGYSPEMVSLILGRVVKHFANAHKLTPAEMLTLVGAAAGINANG